MSKNAKKVASSKSSKKSSGPSLADLVSGKSEAVAKAVAEKRAKVDAATAKAAKAEAKKAPKAAKKGEKKERAPRAGSGSRIKELLRKGMDAEKILAVVHREFPDSKATKGDVAWNKWDMKRKGEKLPA